MARTVNQFMFFNIYSKDLCITYNVETCVGTCLQRALEPEFICKLIWVHCKCIGLTLIHIWPERVFSALGHNGLIKARGRAKVTGLVSKVHFQRSMCELCHGVTFLFKAATAHTTEPHSDTREYRYCWYCEMWVVLTMMLGCCGWFPGCYFAVALDWVDLVPGVWLTQIICQNLNWADINIDVTI